MPETDQYISKILKQLAGSNVVKMTSSHHGNYYIASVSGNNIKIVKNGNTIYTGTN